MKAQRRRFFRGAVAFQIIGDTVVFLLIVDDDLRHFRAQLVAQHAADQPHVLVEQAGRRLLGGAVLDVAPELFQPLQIVGQRVGVDALRRRAQNHAVTDRIQTADRFLETHPLFFLDDALGHAHVAAAGHEHEIAPGQRNARGHARPFVLARRFDDLH